MTQRFFEGAPWRFIFADIPTPGGATGGRTTTWATGIQRNRTITKSLNQPTVVTLDVDPDSSQVWKLDMDGYPLIAQSKRIVYAFRREGQGHSVAGRSAAEPWKIRAAGIVMIVEDQGDTDVPLTHLTCYDPWQYLNARPCLSSAGSFPGPYGLQFFAIPGSQVIGQVLKNTIQSPVGGFAFIDAGLAYGGTGFFGGTIEVTPQVTLNVQQGTSVGDVWRQVIEAGYCDVVLTPIYDPVNRPGYTHELNVYNLAGSKRPNAVFSWDKMNRSASSISRLHDATPGNFSNEVQYYVGQGGPPAPLQSNMASINDFGYYWSTQFYPDQTIPSAAVVTALAEQAIYLQRQGSRTVTLTLTPERSPQPLTEYDVADFVPLWATRRLRVAITSALAPDPISAFRVQTIPIQISDDGIESVNGLVVSPDWRTAVIGGPAPSADVVSVATQAVGRAAARAFRTTYPTQSRVQRRMQVFLSHLSGYGYGT